MFKKVLSKDIHMAVIGEGFNQHVKFMILKNDVGGCVVAGWLLKEDKLIEVEGNGAFGEIYEVKANKIKSSGDLKWSGTHGKIYAVRGDRNKYNMELATPVINLIDKVGSKHIVDKRAVVALENKINSTIKKVWLQNDRNNKRLYQQGLKEEEIVSNYPFNN